MTEGRSLGRGRCDGTCFGVSEQVPTRDRVPRAFLEMMAGRLAILGDPTRLQIIHCLIKDGE